VEIRSHPSIRDLGEQRWNGLLPAEAPPFLSFEWLDALEQSGAVSPARGWAPAHLSLWEEGRLVGAAPAYVKGNSEGEFVFDHAWARFAAERLRIDYYPKLVVAVPFTPATGPRLLLAPEADRDRAHAALAEGLRQLTRHFELSSAHVLFPPKGEAESLERHGLFGRVGIQYHWHNAGYASFEDFLGSFNAKRRAQIRRERRELERGKTRIEHLSGRDLTPEIVDLVFELYRSTVDKYFWGRRYLNRAFFEIVMAAMPDRLHVVLARDGGSSRPIAGAFNLKGSRALYGRYWGTLADEERPFLHFNVCYYEGIEECTLSGLEMFEPGAGGEHKRARGFVPSLTYSAHHLADRRLDVVIRDFVEREREAVEAHVR
jgi:uncharacterized protein